MFATVAKSEEMCYMSCMEKTETITIRLTPTHIATLDRLRMVTPGLPTRAEVMRRLIDEARQRLPADQRQDAPALTT
jgi:hypothetical protein